MSPKTSNPIVVVVRILHPIRRVVACNKGFRFSYPGLEFYQLLLGSWLQVVHLAIPLGVGHVSWLRV